MREILQRLILGIIEAEPAVSSNAKEEGAASRCLDYFVQMDGAKDTLINKSNGTAVEGYNTAIARSKALIVKRLLIHQSISAFAD